MRVALQPSNGEAAGWQLLDRRTGALIEEGEWVMEARDSDVALPAEDGSYRVLVSTVDAERGWAYERGASMRVIDVAVDGGVERVERDRETTLRSLRLERLIPRALQFLAEPWRAMWSNRALIFTMVRRDMETRYRGSMGDRFWSIAQPLLLMLTYWFVFSTVLQSRLQGEGESKWFLLYFLCGMLPWLAFSESVGRAPNAILENRNLVKKLVFPVEILPVNLVAAGMVTFWFAFVVFLFFEMVIHEAISPVVYWIPVLLIPQMLMTAGICWAWAAIGVYLRDLGQMNGFLLTLVFFLTPICYPHDTIPPHIFRILQKNPMYKIVGQYRQLFLGWEHPDWVAWTQVFIFGVIVFYGGYGIFRKMRQGFADAL
ncbi:MAG: ABC transporter permease [Acidobacteria bacterium]|nr:ABC transporter permease [Acidobacteriota bacterium]